MKTLLFVVSLFVATEIMSQPGITSLLPVSGQPGATLKIIGHGFNLTASANIVRFGAVKATVINAAVDTLLVTIPFGATHSVVAVTTNALTAYSSAKFLPVAGLGDSILPSSYPLRQDFPSANYPTITRIADFDDDGLGDIVISNYGSSKISVARNLSATHLQLSGMMLLGVPSSAADLITGDIDGDGKLDIATVNDVSQTISVFQNTTSGGIISFAARQDFAAGIYPTGIAIGDIDGDGKTDIVEISNQDDSVSILRNMGTSGSLLFAPRVSFKVGYGTSHLLVLDMDGDGKLDIICTNQLDSTLSLLKNLSVQGMVSFQNSVDFFTAHSMFGLDAGDLNADGKIDIVTGNEDTTISIFTNTSLNSFDFTHQEIAIGTTPASVEIGDIDGDGKPDIAAAGSATYISLLRNISSGNNILFAPKIDYAEQGSSNDIKIADLNNDGRNDLIVCGLNNVELFRFTIPISISICPGGNANLTDSISSPLYHWQINTGSGFVNLSNDSHYAGVTTATLQFINIPSSWYGYRYRCNMAGYLTDEYALKVENTWTGTVNSSWENSANWSCGGSPDENTDVIINSGTVIINSNITIRSLKLNPGATLTINPGFNLVIIH